MEPPFPIGRERFLTALTEPFPKPGSSVRLAYHELELAENGTLPSREWLGDPAEMPRPWAPATCIDPDLQLELWEWLDDVVCWINHEHTWDPGYAIPVCWPEHPHLANEVAVLADQRRTAGLATTGALLTEWQRYTLPAFLERMRSRLGTRCEAGHQPWPGRGRHRDYRDIRESTPPNG